jgi:hypothetical protein
VNPAGFGPEHSSVKQGRYGSNLVDLGCGVSTGDLSLAALLSCASDGAVLVQGAPPQGREPVLSRTLWLMRRGPRGRSPL